MGMNIYIQRLPDFKDHPDWDSDKWAGSREFASCVLEMPHEAQQVGDFPDIEWFFRPKDFAECRKAIKSGVPNEDLFLSAIDILEKNPDYWIYCSS
jgi:hypothetical protein